MVLEALYESNRRLLAAMAEAAVSLGGGGDALAKERQEMERIMKEYGDALRKRISCAEEMRDEMKRDGNLVNRVAQEILKDPNVPPGHRRAISAMFSGGFTN